MIIATNNENTKVTKIDFVIVNKVKLYCNNCALIFGDISKNILLLTDVIAFLDLWDAMVEKKITN